MLNQLRNRLDPNVRVRVVANQSPRDGRWRWMARADGFPPLPGPIRGSATHDEAMAEAHALLNAGD